MTVLICLGKHPIAGCGNILTDEERHYYGTSCEACAHAWDEAVEAWSEGGDNAELDAMFEGRLINGSLN